MAGEGNVETAQRAYAAFGSGDAEGAMSALSDEVEWIIPGNSGVSGTMRGKQEVGEFWSRLAEKGYTTEPQYWFSDDERVVVLTRTTLDGHNGDEADVLTFRDGRVVRFQAALDTELLARVYGTK
jgi:ketosteroid isomerase-like protein